MFFPIPVLDLAVIVLPKILLILVIVGVTIHYPTGKERLAKVARPLCIFLGIVSFLSIVYNFAFTPFPILSLWYEFFVMVILFNCYKISFKTRPSLKYRNTPSTHFNQE